MLNFYLLLTYSKSIVFYINETTSYAYRFCFPFIIKSSSDFSFKLNFIINSSSLTYPPTKIFFLCYAVFAMNPFTLVFIK